MAHKQERKEELIKVIDQNLDVTINAASVLLFNFFAALAVSIGMWEFAVAMVVLSSLMTALVIKQVLSEETRRWHISPLSVESSNDYLIVTPETKIYFDYVSYQEGDGFHFWGNGQVGAFVEVKAMPTEIKEELQRIEEEEQ